ncbi:MAG: class I SAM-dependent methyltransferase [Elusimicrobiota bacterium]
MENIWDKNWSSANQAEALKGEALRETLGNRFTKDAYNCFKRFVLQEDRNILEAGCGTGRFCYLFARDFPASKVLGLDASAHSIKLANSFKNLLSSNNLEFKMGDIFKIDFPDNYFDVVFNEGVIEHFALSQDLNYKAAFREMVRVAKPGGKILVAVPNWYCFPHVLYKLLKGKSYPYGYEKSFTHRELIALGRENGLGQLELAGWLPSYGVSRLGTRYFGLFKLLGKITDKIQTCVDACSGGWFTRKFGFEIVLRGTKK